MNGLPLETMIDGVLFWLLQAVLLGTVLALVTWAVCRSVLRKASPALHVAIWLIVLVKFVVPAGPGFAYSFSSLLSALPFVPEAAPTAAAPQFVVEVTPATAGNGLAAITTEQVMAQTVTATPTSAASISWGLLIVGAYLLGVAAIFFVRIRAYRQFVQGAQRLPHAGRGVRRLVASACRRLGVHRVPDVRLSDEAHAPYVFGLLRPTLVLPRNQDFSSEEWDAVLLHEVAHLRRSDLWIRYAQWTVGTVLFFWPVVAWVNRRIDLAREHACDEWALRYGRLRPGQYARCLLRVLQPAPARWRAYRPAAMATTVKQVERRIEMIMDHRTRATRTGLRVLATGTVVAWAAFALTGTSAAVQDTPTTEKNVWVSDVGDAHDLEGMKVHFADGANQRFMFQSMSDGDMTHDYAIHLSRHISDQQLAEFANRYPAADVDANGSVSLEEHDAYLVAKAMAAPDKVLEKFPQADADEDGTLSPMEAAGLVSGMQSHDMMLHHADHNVMFAPHLAHIHDVEHGEDGVIVERIGITDDPHQQIFVRAASPDEMDIDVTVDDTGEGTRVIKIDKGDGEIREIHLNTDGDGSTSVEFDNGEIATTAGTMQVIALDDGSGEMQVFSSENGDFDIHEAAHSHLEALHEHLAAAGAWVHGADVEFAWTDEPPTGMTIQLDGGLLDGRLEMLQAGDWLLENIEAEPTREQVAGALGDVRELPLAQFLKLNPEADHNKDGKLTEEERDAFLDRHMTRTRERLLERYPEADANQDGLLTNEELRNYFRDRHRHHRAPRHEEVEVGEPVVEVTED